MDHSWLTEKVGYAYQQVEDAPQDKYLHTFRSHLENPIFEYLRNKYLPGLQTWWSSYELPTDAKNTIFLYETRSDPHLAFVIYNACFYARNYSLSIYCTSNNLPYIRMLLGQNADRAHISLIDDVSTYDGNRDAYNSFLKSRVLWLMLHNRGIEMCLMIELDAYLRDFLPPTIGEFDYVCAKWRWSDGPGGGGLTVRRVEKMLELLDLDPDLAQKIPHQDYWVSTAVSKYGGSVNNTMFFESYLCVDPVGVHQWWTFIPMFEKDALSVFAGYLTLKHLAVSPA